MRFNKSLPARVIGSLFAVFLAAHAVSCGGKEGLLDQARFLLDQCNASVTASLTNCSEAIEKTDEVQNDDPTNLEAAVLEASARLGLAGFDFLQVAEVLTDLQDSADNDFSQFRSLVDTIETNTGRSLDGDELGLAITTLETALAGVDTADEVTDSNQSAVFQLGALKAIDSFLIPVAIAGDNAADIDATTFDDTIDRFVSDFVDADDLLVLSGTTDDEILRPIRENYCRCTLSDPTGELTAACLRDLMRCSLDEAVEDGDSDNVGVEQDYDGNATTNDVDCDTLLTPAGLTACSDDDTTN